MFDQQYLSDTLKFKMAASDPWSGHPKLSILISKAKNLSFFFLQKWILDVDVDRVMQN